MIASSLRHRMDVSPTCESVGCTVSAIGDRASFEKTTHAMKNDLEVEKRWTGGELLVCAIVQLLLVHVAYRLDKRNGAPLISMSSWAILFGILCGFFLSFVSASRLHGAGLDPQILFFGLLPPIILEAGFNTQRKGFFNNFWAILLLAVFGTLIATFITGGILIWLGHNGWITHLTPAEAFLYGSLISAIDPVATLVVFKKCNAPSMLFNLVFGESVLNDAVAIVVFTLFQDFVSSGNSEVNFETGVSMACNFIWIGVGSVALSAVVCYTSAYFLRHSDPHLREHPTYEISIVLLSSYASYVAADLFGLSGLLAVFFSGVIIRHYHMYNISPASAAAFEHLLSTLAFLAENFIYLYLGISVFSYTNAFRWDWMFVLANVVALLVARAFNTFPLCAIANWWRSPAEHIPWRYMVVIWFSGLRGAIAFALALNVQTSNSEHAAVLKSSTLFTVLFTTVFFGMGTGPLLRILKLDNANEEKLLWHARDAETFAGEKMPLLSSSFHDHQSGHGVRNAWVALDEKYLKPLFGGKPRNQTESTTTRLSDSMEPGANGW